MTMIADEYENWFRLGHRDLAEFLSQREAKGNSLDDAQFRDCLLTDQYLRHQIQQPLGVDSYLQQFPQLVNDTELQVDLWLEAFGYFEEQSQKNSSSEETSKKLTSEDREKFLAEVPEAIRPAVAAEVLAETSIDSVNSSSSTNSAPAKAEGETWPEIPRYRIEEVIGRGAFGIVYRGWDPQLERTVAIKVLRSEDSADALFAEARLVASLESPGIVSVYDCGIEKNGRAFLVTALVEGQDLRSWLEAVGRNDLKRICQLFIRLCQALDPAHQAGVVHRDIKPTNIIVQTNDKPVLLDFGLATRNWQSGKQGELVGTPAYMSPEQARGEAHLVDARSDIFSLGILLLESLIGQLPWECSSSKKLIQEIAVGKVRSALQLDCSIPIELDRICSKATASAKAARYHTAADLASELQWFVDNSIGCNSQSVDEVNRTTIRPRGLQPYTNADAESFWQLLPGERNGIGRPDIVSWWLDRLQDNLQHPLSSLRSVLVLYGPSGSGKSSLLSAGVIPFIDSEKSHCVQIDATDLNGQTPLHHQLVAWLPSLQDKQRSTAEQMARLRDNGSRRTIVVIDQFEQVFRSNFSDQREQLFLAMRQADGQRLQFVLVVRDEFWSAISHWMRRLDAPLRDGRNAMALEKFSRPHAINVMRFWAESIAVSLPDDFLERAVDAIVHDGQVIPVRLALLANIFDKGNWTDDQLFKITSHSSLSGYYLDTVLGELAPAARRKLFGPAKEVLRSLTPVSGNIRGQAKSTQEMKIACQASGQRVTDSEFEDLFDLLDRQLHLVMPVENENLQRPFCEDSEMVVKSSSYHYQLTHDFLVSEIRRWLRTQDRQSLTGRALSDLRFAASRWKEDQRKSNLAGPVDCLRYGLLVRRSQARHAVERDFLIASARQHLLHSLVIGLAVTCMFALFYTTLQQSRGQEIVQRLKSSSWDEFPTALMETHRNRFWTYDPLASALQVHRADLADKTVDKEQRDRLALAMLRYDSNQATYLTDRLPEMIPEANFVFANQMCRILEESDRLAVADQLAAKASDETQIGEFRLKAAIAIAVIVPQHSFWKESSGQICQLLVDANPTDLGWLANGLSPVRKQLADVLARSRQNADSNRTVAFLLAEFASDSPDALIDLIEDTAVSNLSAVFSTIRDLDSREFDASLKARFVDAVESWDTRLVEHKPSSIPRPDNYLAEDNSSVVLARRVGNLGAALILRRKANLVVDHLRRKEDPTIRSYLIHCYAAGNGPAQPIAELLYSPDRASSGVAGDLPDDIAAALLQMIGSLPASSKVPSSIRVVANRLYRNCENAELNASAEWFLRKHGYESDLLDAELADSVGYQTSEGHAMVRLPGGVVAKVGASQGDRNQLPNEEPHDIEVPKHIFFSRHELTREQLERFLADTEGNSPQEHPYNTAQIQGDREIRGDQEMRISFFTAAAYCNWLSEKEGIPKDQWCYLPNRDGNIGPGMQIASDLLQRTGYQIPTPDIWEYACRGGSTTPRPFGSGIELSSRYVRWSGTRSKDRQRSAVRLPNAYGLFDMLGNTPEWTTGLVDGMYRRDSAANTTRLDFGPLPVDGNRGPRRFRTGQPGLAFGGGPILIDSAGKTIERSNQFAILGGGYDAPAHKIRSSDRSIISPTLTNKAVTLRLMRIISDK